MMFTLMPTGATHQARSLLARTPLRIYAIAVVAVTALAIFFFFSYPILPGEMRGLLSLLFLVLVLLIATITAAISRRIANLALSESNYCSLVQGATYGIFRSNRQGLMFANPALVKMLGYDSEAELLAIDLDSDLYRDAGERDRLFNRYMDEDYVEGVELRWKRKDGSVITVRVSSRVLRDESGQPESFEGIVEDVTARHVIEAQLRHSDKLTALGRLVAGAAHEINNPLTAIYGYAELLATNPALPEELRDFAEKIQQQARRTKAITASLQNFSQQASREKKQLLDLNTLLNNALRIQEMNLAPNNITFKSSLDPQLPRVLGDEYQLLEVCMHILNNSVDALKSAGGGSITARTSAENGQVVLAFSDSGPGIEDLSRIFDPFYTTKPVGNGAGLGLSACYGIIKDHGGSIVAANGPEGGAQVIIKLPAAKAEADAALSTAAQKSN